MFKKIGDTKMKKIKKMNSKFDSIKETIEWFAYSVVLMLVFYVFVCFAYC